jgi:(R,R)-butanediol dehydrogenase / meso-butanediol dehydrogenase / diacetyl reductase
VRAAVYRGPGDIRIEDVTEPVPAGDELLLQVAATGVCGTDGHEYAHGPFQFAVPSRSAWGPVGGLIPGHEFSGTVVGMGEHVTGFSEGDLVASASGVACGECIWCRRGRTNLCLSYETVGLQRHGGLAQLCVVPARSCAVVDRGTLTADAAALAQPMAIAVHAASLGEPAAGMEVLVVGAGGIGAFLIFVLSQSGARVSVIEMDASRRELAISLGATAALPPPAPGALQATLRAGEPPELVYEVTGNPAGLALALASLGRGVRLVVVGLQGRPAELDLRKLSISECQLIGTNALVTATDLPKALQLLGRRSGSWADVAPTALALDDLVDEAIRPLARGKPIRVKTLIDPWTPATRSTQM